MCLLYNHLLLLYLLATFGQFRSETRKFTFSNVQDCRTFPFSNSVCPFSASKQKLLSRRYLKIVHDWTTKLCEMIDLCMRIWFKCFLSIGFQSSQKVILSYCYISMIFFSTWKKQLFYKLIYVFSITFLLL